MTAAAEAWLEHRDHLRGVAYRMLGSRTDAEDVLQEAYLRLERTGTDAIDDLRGWLITVVGRLCLDRLRSAPARREAYVGPWLPEPLVDGGEADPADEVVMAESVSMAFLVILESLSPAERVAFLLHDVFGHGYGDLARILERSEDACRQLVSRARRHVDERRPRFEADRRQRDRVATEFLEACAGGRLERLLALLAPDAVCVSDGGGKARAARRPIVGADRVARFLLGITATGLERGGRARPVQVNGATGALLEMPDGPFAIASIEAAGGRVQRVNIVVNPDKVAAALRAG